MSGETGETRAATQRLGNGGRQAIERCERLHQGVVQPLHQSEASLADDSDDVVSISEDSLLALALDRRKEKRTRRRQEWWFDREAAAGRS